MIKLDRIKMIIPEYLYEGIETEGIVKSHQLSESNEVLGDGEILRFHRSTFPIGLTEGFLKIGVGCFFDFTGMILGEDYPQLIHARNIRNVLSSILKERLIGYDLDEIIESSEILIVDVTRDFHSQLPIMDTLASLGLIRHPKFHTLPWDTAITYLERQKKGKRKLKFYDKEKELRSKRKYLDTYGRDKMLTAFKDTIRMEYSLCTRKALKKYFPQTNGTITLKSVLESQANPLSDIFSTITEGITEEPIPLPIPPTIAKTEKQLGQQAILDLHGMNIHRVRSFLQQKSRGNISRKLREYKDLLHQMMNIRVYEEGGYGHLSRLRKLLEKDAE